ncbi:MAG: radical SAM protein [Pirellulaceae bacterium]
MPPAPDQALHCLLIQPEFAASNYWNFVEAANAIGAKATAPPLGLLTVAAILPNHWTFELVDLNVRPITEQQWDAADLVCTGGMLPQQAGVLQIIEEAMQRGKYVVVGGPDPTSQPQIYAHSDALVLGEGELSIPIWLDSWRNGQPYGTFATNDSPDISQSPIPRFDLIRFDDYLYVGLQSSRGCPYNCEFCDVIELFGRKPRVKQPSQFVKELQRLEELGYRGWIDIADDNFIGNRLKTKPLLQAVAEWSQAQRYPFFFSTEASVNLADDDELLELMRECQFQYVFLGIETPDEQVLVQTQKRINTVKPLIDRVRRIYSYGISITAGFIIGFDSEPENPEQTITEFVQESGIMLAMIGLLSALPNTQLTKRLGRERRLIDSNHQWIDDPSEDYELRSETSMDQTMGGLNFVTIRDRVDIYRQLKNIIQDVYHPRAFMDRVLDTTRRLELRSKHRPNLWELRRMLRGWAVLSTKLLIHRQTRYYYLRNAWKSLWMGPAKFIFAHQLMGSYLHFARQTDRMIRELDVSIEYSETQATYPRSVADPRLQTERRLPVHS